MAPLPPLQRLINALARLPGVGRRSAERMTMRLARDRGALKRELIAALEEVEKTVCTCRTCGDLTLTEANPCRICSDPRRGNGQLCVVEDPSDVAHLEGTGAYRGRYHVLGGKLSPMQEQGVADLRLGRLAERIGAEEIREVILALNADVESDATARLLREALGAGGVRVFRLALGLSAGSGVAYADAVTLARSLEGRQAL